MPLYLCLYRPGQGASADATCFVRIEDPAGSLPMGVREFCTLHGLTEAEAGIVAGIAEGLTLAQIAARRRRSQDTVRTQVKTIFWKTGCTRQADIIRQVTLMSQQHERPLTAPFALPALAGMSARPRCTRS